MADRALAGISFNFLPPFIRYNKMKNSQNSSSRWLILTSVAAAVILSACATEPDRKGPSPDRQGAKKNARSSGTFLQPIAALLIDMDTNNDKVTDRSELTAGTQREWEGFDRNPSAIPFSEWSVTTLGSADAQPNFLNFDRDFNGAITEREFSNQLESQFDRLDKNADGRLERSELLVAFQAQQGRGGGKSGQGGGQKNGQRGGGGGGGGGRSR